MSLFSRPPTVMVCATTIAPWAPWTTRGDTEVSPRSPSQPRLVGRRRDGNRRGPREVLDHLLALLRIIHPKLVEVEGALGDTVRRDRRVAAMQRVEQVVLGCPVLPGVTDGSQ